MGERLSEEDFNRLRAIMKAAIREETPSVVRQELVNIGLSAHDEDGRIEIQKNMSFLNYMRKSFENAASVVGKAILISILGIIGSILTAGFWAYIKAKT